MARLQRRPVPESALGATLDVRTASALAVTELVQLAASGGARALESRACRRGSTADQAQLEPRVRGSPKRLEPETDARRRPGVLASNRSDVARTHVPDDRAT